jgi:hypothetical protein
LSTTITSRLSYNDIFNDKTSLNSLVKKIDVKQSLELLAIINKYQYKIYENESSEIKFILNEWLIDSGSELKNHIINCYAKSIDSSVKRGITQIDFSNVKIINRISTLRLIEILLSQKDNVIELPRKENSLLLFKLYLLSSAEISERQDKIFKKFFVNKKTFLDSIYFHLFLGLTHPMEKNSQSKKIVVEVLKFIQFEKWLRKNNDYFEMTNDYVKKIGLNNWYEYFNDVFSLNRVGLSTHIISIRDYPILANILNFFSSDRNFTSEWSELINLKKQPLIKTNDDTYILLDLEYLLSKFFSGLYHEILNFSKGYFGNKFSQDYNDSFIEQELLCNCIKIVFEKSYVKYSEKEIEQHKTKNIQNLGLPDYYIRNGNKVFLFECKNSYISNKNKVNLDAEKLLKEIRDKFYFTETKNSIKKKAIKQLVSFIQNSIQGKYDFFDTVKKKKNLVFFPILIVTDDTLCSLGFNQLLNHYLNSEIKNSKELNGAKIKHLTIIHFDDFLNHQNSLKKLDTIILKYHSFINNKNGFDAMISFSDYLDTELLIDSNSLNRKSVEHILEDSLLPKE